jgi:hypothetical protein
MIIREWLAQRFTIALTVRVSCTITHVAVDALRCKVVVVLSATINDSNDVTDRDRVRVRPARVRI